MAWTNRLLCAALIFGITGSVNAEDAPDPKPVNAIRGIVSAFDQYPVVAIAESHGLRPAGDFYILLVKDPVFAAKVNDIVVEFGSRRSQTVVDRYIAGENVPQEELQHIWRDSTKVMSWESPIYPELLAAVREVNGTLPPKRRLRVLAGDSPIDWANVHSNEDWGRSQPNNNSFSAVIINEVLQKQRKALVILGGNHLTKSGDRDGGPDTTTLVEDKYPGSMYVVMMHSGLIPIDEQSMTGWKVPSIVPTKGTWVGSVSAGGRTLQVLGDALLYLGPKSSLVQAQPDWGRLKSDTAYMKELARRFQLVYGCAFDAKLLGGGARPCG